jgi:hypothetical protein
MKTIAQFALAVCAAAILIAAARGTAANVPSPDAKFVPVPRGKPAQQGCVNQGSDVRVGAPFVCWAQRHLSWKSSRQPHFLLLGKHNATSVGLAWPPYLVFNASAKDGRWRMFRIGFRYDRTWRGYIFPTAAWKEVNTPLKY